MVRYDAVRCGTIPSRQIWPDGPGRPAGVWPAGRPVGRTPRDWESFSRDDVSPPGTVNHGDYRWTVLPGVPLADGSGVASAIHQLANPLPIVCTEYNPEPTDQPTDRRHRLTGGQTDRKTDGGTGVGRPDLPTGRPIDRPTNRPAINRPTGLTDRTTVRRTDRHTNHRAIPTDWRMNKATKLNRWIVCLSD